MACSILQEYLSGITEDEEEKELSYKCKWFFIRLLTNILILGMIGGSGYLVFWLSEELQTVKVGSFEGGASHIRRIS